MEDLADLNLQFSSNLSSIEELCGVNMDSEMNLSGNGGRPWAEMSMGSWTFSPISENDGDANEDLDSSEKSAASDVANQEMALSGSQPISNSITSEQMAPFVQQGNQENSSASCEYVYPNTITYHHSVNIHNYVGNYCMGPQSPWKPDVIYQMPSNFQGYSTRPMPPPKAIVQLPDRSDPLSTLNSASMDFTRCSTPEYLMALNSLQQLDSPLRPNHTAATNLNYTCSSFNESLHNKTVNRLPQDSGYSSDLGESPIIQFQDGNIKTYPGRLTSTPLPPPVLRLTNIAEVNKENVSPMQQQFPPARFNLQEYVSKQQCTGEKTAVLSQSENNAASHEFSVPKRTETKSEPKFANMAEYQSAKRSAAQKRKNLSTSDDSEQSNGRRRHNEPLNNMALQVMNNWYQQNSENPYPSKAEKEELARRGGITLAQVKSWFANKRNRSNNTRPKKQKIEMEGRLMEICHQLARDARKPNKDNAYYIQQLSSILHDKRF